MRKPVLSGHKLNCTPSYRVINGTQKGKREPSSATTLRGEIPRGCPGLSTPQAVNSVFTRPLASAKS